MTSKFTLEEVWRLQSKSTRPVQEDALYFDPKRSLVVLADGFGGAGYGDKAAQVVCDATQVFLSHEMQDAEATLPFVLRSYLSLAANVLFNALVHANRECIATFLDKGANERGGATCMAAFLDETLLAIAQVGDTRAWLKRGNSEWVPLTQTRNWATRQDPSHLFRQVNSNTSQTQERLQSPYWRFPLTALGLYSDFEPEMFEFSVQKDDLLLFQSDGLTLEQLELISVFCQGIQNQACLNASQKLSLQERILELKTDDNITALLLRVQEG